MNDRTILFLISILLCFYTIYHIHQWYVQTAPTPEITAPTMETIARDIIAHPEKYRDRSLDASMLYIYTEANAYQPPTWGDLMIFILLRAIGFILAIILIPIIAVNAYYCLLYFVTNTIMLQLFGASVMGGHVGACSGNPFRRRIGYTGLFGDLSNLLSD